MGRYLKEQAGWGHGRERWTESLVMSPYGEDVAGSTLVSRFDDNFYDNQNMELSQDGMYIKPRIGLRTSGNKISDIREDSRPKSKDDGIE